MSMPSNPKGKWIVDQAYTVGDYGSQYVKVWISRWRGIPSGSGYPAKYLMLTDRETKNVSTEKAIELIRKDGYNAFAERSYARIRRANESINRPYQ